MYEGIDKMIERTKEAFPKSYIYKENELIIEPKTNIYFRIDNVNNDLEFTCKMIEYLSRPAHKGVSRKWEKHIREGMNRFLSTNFRVKELITIYTKLGGGVNRTKTKLFIESGYDLTVLK